VQRRFLGLGAAVPADHAQLRHGHVELVPVAVLEQQELARAVLETQRHQPVEPANAVLLVHYRIADLELREVAQHAVDRARLLRGARPAADHARVELGLGDDRPSLGGNGEAVLQRGDADAEAFLVFDEVLKTRARRRFEAVLGEVGEHGFASPGRFRGDEDT